MGEKLKPWRENILTILKQFSTGNCPQVKCVKRRKTFMQKIQKFFFKE